MRNRKIKKHILSFRDHLLHEDYSPKTVSVIMTIIRSFYNEFDIELPRTYLKQKQEQEDIKDIPNMEDIRFAIKRVDRKYKAIITLMLSSGMGASEISSLTYQNFYDSIKKYVEKDIKNPLDVVELKQILDKNDELLVGTWNIQRIKTGLNYTTFSTPESIYSILDYLEKYPSTALSDPLFKSQVETIPNLKPKTIFQYFHRLNINCGFGKPNRQSFLRSHSLRKYFATTLYKKGIPQLSIDFLLAHKIDSVTAAYFKADMESLKNQYLTCIEDLSVEDTKVKTYKSPEFIQVENKMQEMKEYNKKMEERMAAMERQLKRRAEIEKLRPEEK